MVRHDLIHGRRMADRLAALSSAGASAAEREEVELHLAACPICQDAVRQANEGERLLRAARPTVPQLHAAAAERMLQHAIAAAERRRRPAVPLVFGACAAGAVVAAGFALFLFGRSAVLAELTSFSKRPMNVAALPGDRIAEPPPVRFKAVHKSDAVIPSPIPLEAPVRMATLAPPRSIREREEMPRPPRVNAQSESLASAESPVANPLLLVAVSHGDSPAASDSGLESAGGNAAPSFARAAGLHIDALGPHVTECTITTRGAQIIEEKSTIIPPTVSTSPAVLRIAALRTTNTGREDAP